MQEYREGDKIPSICANCNKGVTATLTNETISLCEGLQDIENVIVDICDECGHICSISHEFVKPVQEAVKKLLASKAVSDSGEITIELKSQVDDKKATSSKTERNYPQEYPMVAAAE